MDTGIVRPSQLLPQPLSPQAQQAARTVAPTELPPLQTVEPISKGRPTAESDPKSAGAQAPRQLKRETLRDSSTDTVIFRATDTETGEVVMQIPEEAMLRLRQALADSEQSEPVRPSFSRTL